MGEREKTKAKSGRGRIKEPPVPSDFPNKSAEDVRRAIYSAFNILGFFILDKKHLFAVAKYVNAEGYEIISCHLFFSTVDYVPFEIRREMYRDMAPYLKSKLVKNDFEMPKNVKELQDIMKFKASHLEIL
jgi:hypothetical protein